MKGNKFAVLHCTEDPEYVKNKYGGYFGVYVKMLAEEGETWDLYRVAHGEFPADDVIGDYDGFVITGSRYDAHGNDLWIYKLMDLIKKLDSAKKKVLGICFGHQILARSLGGSIDKATSGWDVGVTTVNLSTTSKLFNTLNIPAVLQVIQCHRDEIVELPREAKVLAWSNKTGIEMFGYGDHILGIQGHPEYTKDIILHLIHLGLQLNVIQKSVADEAITKLKERDPDREAWKKLCVNFLKSAL